jgi:hypothetical protein
MGLLSFTGNFSSPAATDSSFAVTGVGFTPKLVIFWPHAGGATGATSTTDATHGQGVMTAAAQWYTGFGVTDGPATTAVDYSRHTGRCIIVNDGSGTSREEASFVSLDSDGFTINYSKVSGSLLKVAFTCYGGSDCDFEVGQTTITSAGGTGTVATTTGFQPSGYLIAASSQSTADTLATSGHATFSFGASAGATEEFACSIFDEDNVARTDTGRSISTTAVLEMMSAGTTVDLSAEHSAFAATSFTINVTNAATSDTAFCWVAFGGLGLDCFVGNFTTTVAVSTQAVTIETGFSPLSVIAATADLTTVGAANNAVMARGMFTGVTTLGTAQSVAFAEDDNNAVGVPVLNYIHDGMRSEIVHATGFADAKYDIDSLDANGFTIGYAFGSEEAGVLNIHAYLALKRIASQSQPAASMMRRMASHLAR